MEGDRTITIYPKKEGPIEIRVEDIEIPGLSKAEQERIGTEVKEADVQVQEKIENAKKEYLEKYQDIYIQMGLNQSFNPVAN